VGVACSSFASSTFSCSCGLDAGGLLSGVTFNGVVSLVCSSWLSSLLSAFLLVSILSLGSSLVLTLFGSVLVFSDVVGFVRLSDSVVSSGVSAKLCSC